jgi:hypothetical protein
MSRRRPNLDSHLPQGVWEERGCGGLGLPCSERSGLSEERSGLRALREHHERRRRRPFAAGVWARRVERLPIALVEVAHGARDASEGFGRGDGRTAARPSPRRRRMGEDIDVRRLRAPRLSRMRTLGEREEDGQCGERRVRTEQNAPGRWERWVDLFERVSMWRIA